MFLVWPKEATAPSGRLVSLFHRPSSSFCCSSEPPADRLTLSVLSKDSRPEEGLSGHLELQREGNLVNKPRPHRAVGEGQGKRVWHFRAGAKIEGHQTQPLLAVPMRIDKHMQFPWMTRPSLNSPGSWGIPSVVLAWSRPNPCPGLTFHSLQSTLSPGSQRKGLYHYPNSQSRKLRLQKQRTISWLHSHTPWGLDDNVYILSPNPNLFLCLYSLPPRTSALCCVLDGLEVLIQGSIQSKAGESWAWSVNAIVLFERSLPVGLSGVIPLIENGSSSTENDGKQANGYLLRGG